MVWRDGVWLGGVWLGGDWRGGVWRDGDWRGEKISNAPINICGLKWPVVIAGTRMHIGCELHKIAEWREFDDATINKMGRGALKFWRENKNALLALCEMHEERK